MADNKLAVTIEIRDILLSSDEITSLIGDKVFPVIAPTDTEGDFIVYQRDGYKEDFTKMGIARQIPLVYINAVSDDYDRSLTLATSIYEALSGTFTNPYMTIRLEDSTEDYAEGKFIQILQFSID